MFSSEITLKEFICPIPICYQDFSLESLITRVQSSKNGIVAIVNREQSPMGIVRGHRLLSLVTNKNLERVVGGKKKDIFSETTNDSKLLFDYERLITPTPVVSSQLNIKELLPHLDIQNSEITDEKVYLVVDSTGKLLGAIDIHRLLNFLLTETNYQKTTIKEKKLSLEEDLYRLLDKIPLPIILKSKEGETLYSNLYCYNYNHCVQGDISLNSFLYQFLPQPVITELSTNSRINKSRITSYQTQCLKSENTLSETLELEKVPAENTLFLEQKHCKYLKLPLNFSQNFWLAPNSPLKESWLAIKIQSENQVEQNDLNLYDTDLVKLNYLKNEFLSNLGHDLKSPLTAIIGLSSLLKAQKVGDLNKRQIDYIDLIYRSGQKLMTIINDLIDMSRVAGAKSEINLESLEIKEMCEEIYQQVSDKLKLNQEVDNNNFSGQSQPALNIKIHPSLKTIIADEICLGQILNQLLNNALRHTQNRKPIGIEVDNWTEWVAIMIWDRGEVIPEAQQNLLLSQPIKLTSPELNGDLDNNLGLVFAQKLARVHGGDISFISTTNQGNKFTVILPRQSTVAGEKKQIKNSQQYSVSEPDKAKNLLVLIVETSSSTIEYLNNKLEKLGYYPVFARSLEEVLYKATNLKPHKIIINGELVKTWDRDVIALLSNQNQTQDIPVLQMSFGKSASEPLSVMEKPILPLQGGEWTSIDSLILAFPPVVKKNQQPIKFDRSLTILRLLASYQLEENFSERDLGLDFCFDDRGFTCQHRIIEADSLEQAHMLARIWKIDAVILDGRNLLNPSDYLLSLKDSDVLSKLPLITLDAKTTEAANQINGLSIFPCLLPSDARNMDGLLQVIQIATRVDLES